MKESLLPNYFKKIGLIFGSFSIIFLILNLSYPDLIQSNQQLIKWIFKDVLLISLLLIAFAKDKNESDQLHKIRFEQLKRSVLFGGLVLVFDSISELAFDKGHMDMKSGYEIMLLVLFFYLISYNFKKYNYD